MLEAEWLDANGDGVHGLCSFVEDKLKYFAQTVTSSDDFAALWKNKEGSVQHKALLSALSRPWHRMTYTEAVDKLQDAKASFEFEPKWGHSLQSEHEKWLAEELVGGPVFVVDYPRTLKPFYMRDNVDGKTVACFDLLVPYLGELIGGSVREERADVLADKMKAAGLDGDEYSWYLDLRKYGGAPHGGYGMGFERLVSWLGGIDNVRECVPMPRWAGRMQL